MRRAPYAGLTPERVLDAIAALGLRPDGTLQALPSYENRVYQVGMEEGPPLVAKFYRPARWSDEQILEEHAFALELAEREIPAVAPLALRGATLHAAGGFRFALYPRRGGRAPELEDPATLEWLGRFLGRIHAVGVARPFRTRPALDLTSHGTRPREWLLASGWLPAELRAAWESASAAALEAAARCYARAGELAQIRLHGDCHAGNILWTAGGPHFVDLDDCCTGPAVQDLWMLLSGERAAMQRQLAALLAGYRLFRDFHPRELALVEALRTLRLIHYCAWIARRWDDPAFPAAFPWFGTQRYWEERIAELREQLAAMQQDPLALEP